MKIPHELTTPTSVSKILAAMLFIFLPFLGFFIGMQYGASMAKIQRTPMLNRPSARVEEASPSGAMKATPSAKVSPTEKVMKKAY